MIANYRSKVKEDEIRNEDLLFTKILNLSNVALTQEEIGFLKLGLSFTPTPKQNIAELENYSFQFTRKLRLVYHYRNSNIVDESIVKLESTYTPKPNENTDLENICKELEYTKISLFKTKDNLHTFRKGLDSLIKKIENTEIIIKAAGKTFSYCYYVPRLLLEYMSVPYFRYIILQNVK